MKPIPVLGIPHYNRPDLTVRCLESIDYPVDRLVLVNNGSEDLKSSILYALLKKQAVIRHAKIIEHPNAGVAGAWNEIIKLFPGNPPQPYPLSGEGGEDGQCAPHHWWLISNNDIQFAPGDLAKLAGELEQHWLPGQRPPQLFYGNHGASWFALTAQCVATAGLFDENFYPAYDEDCDYARRCDLLGVPRSDVPDVHAIHGAATSPTDTSKGSSTIMSDPDARAKNGRTHGSNNTYYARKWGGLPGCETFAQPFNDPAWPVWAWHFEPAMRRVNQW